MTILTCLTLLALGLVFGIFTTCSSIMDDVQKNLNSGYYVLKGQAYKVTKIKE